MGTRRNEDGMKKKIALMVLAIILGSIAAETVNARWRLFRRRGGSVGTAPQAWHDGTDQQKCQIEAQYMHDNNIHGHVFGVIGTFEGCGWGGKYTNWATCTPNARRGLVLTGDARVGNFRVRSWRKNVPQETETPITLTEEEGAIVIPTVTSTPPTQTVRRRRLFGRIADRRANRRERRLQG